MNKKAMIVLAEGFEEIEAISPMDILRRAEVKVVVAGLGGDLITGAHGVSMKTDTVFSGEGELPDAVVFPGGLPGAENLAGSSKLKEMILKMNSRGKLIAAICASPALVLAPTGILSGKSATCYPGLEKNFSTDIKFVKEKVIRDGNVITSRGPATAFAFGVKIAEVLAGKAKAEMVADQMLY
ncbi:MAG: DJ-1 family glyoxalase III [Candidatus Omnitrophota bacterium]|nr:DJ-1 family glyoxalase III [Candidatus Omnitrophota bacterium]